MTSEHESESAVSRRAVIRGAAVSGVALPLLAACGGGGASASGSGSGGSGSSGGKVTLPESEVPVGGGKILAADQVVVTQPTKGTFKAFSAICTHQACVVGEISNKQIICPCHGSAYSISDGSVLSGPAPSPLPEKKVSVKGGQISVS